MVGGGGGGFRLQRGSNSRAALIQNALQNVIKLRKWVG